MIALESDPWANGVLHPEKHAVFATRATKYAQDAGVPAPYLWSKTEDLLTRPDEMEWLIQYRANRMAGAAGLIYLGTGYDPSVEVRMFGIAGKLVRNFIRARVLPLETVFQDMASKGTVEASCLLLPTFVDAKPHERRISWMADLLLSRFNDTNMQTVLFAASLDAVDQAYGSWVRDHIASNYVTIAGQKVKGPAK